MKETCRTQSKEGIALPISYMIGGFFFFVLFIAGMIFAKQSMWVLILGVIGLIGTSYYLTRIVSSTLREMRKRNTEKDR